MKTTAQFSEPPVVCFFFFFFFFFVTQRVRTQNSKQCSTRFSVLNFHVPREWPARQKRETCDEEGGTKNEHKTAWPWLMPSCWYRTVPELRNFKVPKYIFFWSYFQLVTHVFEFDKDFCDVMKHFKNNEKSRGSELWEWCLWLLSLWKFIMFSCLNCC